MKKISIILYGLGVGNFFQANIKIFDQNNNLILNTTTYNGRIDVYLKENETYRVCAYSCGETINKVIYVDCIYDKYSFYFSRVLNNNTITFLLTDYYYNLPIKKGEILFG